ncbi:hypothetical protein UPYG_G00001400 [Umbra pygmaea]|uniref:MyoD family inhibitor n=1 Tax=Umbra pygmaea TaxID=75934 RepID=A0ABD0XGE1_UMBPY
MDAVEVRQQMKLEQTDIIQEGANGKEGPPLDLSEPAPQPLPCAFTHQPLPNGTAGQHAVEPGASDKGGRAADDGESDDSLTDHNSTTDVSWLLPERVPTNPYRLGRDESPREVPVSSSPKTSPKTLTTRPSPVGSPLPSSSNHIEWSPRQAPQLPACHHGHPNQKERLPSTTKSQKSLKADATQIKDIAGDDCCVHCVLACLFCELQSLCSVLAQCLLCGDGCEGLCCCTEGASGGIACGEDACSALLDCGILEDCCESSDCLEVCMECCSICFPA